MTDQKSSKKPLELNWLNIAILTVPPLTALYGCFTWDIQLATFIWAIVYYFCTGLSITAGMYESYCGVVIIGLDAAPA